MRTRDLPTVLKVADASLPVPWSEAIWREELISPFGVYLVLEEESAISGFIGAKRVADEAHVMTLAVRPERRRRGLGRFLVRSALASVSGVRRIHLEVRPTNAAARTLYASLGFVETGSRKNYYGNEDALLMTLDLRSPDDSRFPFASPPGAGAAPRGPRRA